MRAPARISLATRYAASLALLPPLAARRAGTVLVVAGSALWGARFTGLLS